MLICHRQDIALHQRATGFTLIEVLIAFAILALTIAGIVYGYAEANRMAEWSSMSIAAQSYALEGMEQARAAKWNPWDFTTNTGLGTQDELPPSSSSAVLVQQDLLDIPIKGDPYSSVTNGGYTNYNFFATNYVYVTDITSGNNNAYLRQIKSTCVWTFPATGKTFTNTVITFRASDQ